MVGSTASNTPSHSPRSRQGRAFKSRPPRRGRVFWGSPTCRRGSRRRGAGDPVTTCGTIRLLGQIVAAGILSASANGSGSILGIDLAVIPRTASSPTMAGAPSGVVYPLKRIHLVALGRVTALMLRLRRSVMRSTHRACTNSSGATRPIRCATACGFILAKGPRRARVEDQAVQITFHPDETAVASFSWKAVHRRRADWFNAGGRAQLTLRDEVRSCARHDHAHAAVRANQPAPSGRRARPPGKAAQKPPYAESGVGTIAWSVWGTNARDVS